jgi:ribulose 1,5-bisphosphate synthetase/thiazole synthase
MKNRKPYTGGGLTGGGVPCKKVLVVMEHIHIRLEFLITYLNFD